MGVVRLVRVVDQLTGRVVQGHLSMSREALGELEDRDQAGEARHEDGDNVVELRLASRVHQVDGVGQQRFILSFRFIDEVTKVALELGKQTLNVVRVILEGSGKLLFEDFANL